MLDKFGGDSLGETRDNLQRYRARIEAPLAGTPAAGESGATQPAEGSDIAGSGGDD